MMKKHLPAIATLLISTFWGSQAFASCADLGCTRIRFSYTSPCSNSSNQELVASRPSIKSTLQPLNIVPALLWGIDANVTWKSEPQLVAQSGSMQDAVNFIHRLRKEGRIEIGTNNTYYFGNVRGQHVKIGTTKSGRGLFSNWVFLTEMPAYSGYGFRVVGSNSYEFLGVTVNGRHTKCPGSCPVLNAK